MKRSLLVLLFSGLMVSPVAFGLKSIANPQGNHLDYYAQSSQSPAVKASQALIKRINVLPLSRQHKPEIVKMAVNEPFAIASWELGPTGGIATLKQLNGEWTVLSLQTRGWKSAKHYAQEFSIPQQKAEWMLDRVMPQWRKYEP